MAVTIGSVLMDPATLRPKHKEAMERLISRVVAAVNIETNAMIARETQAMMAALGLSDTSSAL